MNLYSDVPGRMEYIQKLFLDVETAVEKIQALGEVIAFLEREPPEFRSISYESASMQIGLRDLRTNKQLDGWLEFREACGNQHAFHMYIGLGWAFAKTGLSPESYLSSLHPIAKWMALDGMGYYYGLFKGRDTLKNKIVPEGIEGESQHGFDQGLGRRLWYITKGNINEVNDWIESFSKYRHADLYRGIGIACGYVGGTCEDDLKRLLTISGEHYKQLQLGIMLAAISRIASNSINEDVSMACDIICNKTENKLFIPGNEVTANSFYLYKAGNIDHWFALIQSELLQTNEAYLNISNNPKPSYE